MPLSTKLEEGKLYRVLDLSMSHTLKLLRELAKYILIIRPYRGFK